jgi:predicted Zn-dependent peptidase
LESLGLAAQKAGGEIGATVGDDFVEIWGEGDSGTGKDLLKLALALLRDPRLDDDAVKAARDKMLNQVELGSGDTSNKIQASLRSQLYRDARGELAAYGLPEFGTIDSLNSLTADKVRDLYNQRLKSARLVVSAVGDVDVAGFRDMLQALPATHSMTPAEPFFAAPKSKEPKLIVRELPSPVALIFVAYSLPQAKPEEIPALQVLSAALSDTPGARLPARVLSHGLVDNRNKAFSVAASLTPRRYAGELLITANCASQSVDSVKNDVLDEVRKMRDGLLTPQELQAAKTLVRGNWSVERENLRDRAFQTALAPALGAPPDTTWPTRVQAVTAEEVQRVAKKYLNNYAVALVMPSEDVTPR